MLLRYCSFLSLFATAGFASSVDNGAANLISRQFPDNPPPGSVQITDLVYSGTGCLAGSGSAVLTSSTPGGGRRPSPVMSIKFKGWNMAIGPKVPRSQSLKNCQAKFRVEFPSGWKMILPHRGDGWSYAFVDLEKGVNATQKYTQYFSGGYDKSLTTMDTVGPLVGNILPENDVVRTILLESPCSEGMGVVFNVDIQTALLNNTVALGKFSGQIREGKALRFDVPYGFTDHGCNRRSTTMTMPTLTFTPTPTFTPTSTLTPTPSLS
ncbi:hypothetical protein FQN57_002933 [Myotisia sp. PD_48]|nr:hypothetical protein FQN57_002933 [Myotisia sp. PD_48]